MNELSLCKCNKKREFVNQVIKLSKKYGFTLYQLDPDSAPDLDTEGERHSGYYQSLGLLHELVYKIKCDKCVN